MLDTTGWTPELARKRHKEFHRKIEQKAAEAERAKIAKEEEAERARVNRQLQWHAATLAIEISRKKKIKELQDQVAIATAKLRQLNTPVETEVFKASPMFSDIMNEVCAHYGVKAFDIRSARRTMNLVQPRQVICFLAKELTPLSLPQIGRYLGGRDHTTVLHGIRKVGCLLEFAEPTDPIRMSVDEIRDNINKRVAERQARHEALIAAADRGEADAVEASQG